MCVEEPADHRETYMKSFGIFEWIDRCLVSAEEGKSLDDIRISIPQWCFVGEDVAV
jgi:hypothetical protein